jgi:hypothetical protein
VKKSPTVVRPAAVESPRHLPLVDLLVDARSELFELAVRSGLKVLETMLEADRTAICGPRYAHVAARGFRSHSRESRRILRFPAENLLIAILSWRVAIYGLPTRSLHNLLHQRNRLGHELPGAVNEIPRLPTPRIAEFRGPAVPIPSRTSFSTSNAATCSADG